MLRLAFAVAVAASLLGCKGSPTKLDVYMEGLSIEGDAEKSVCKLHGSDPMAPAVLSGDQVSRCLDLTEQALAKYDQAAAMGLSDPDFVKVHERAKDRRERLQSMLAQVRSIEREQAGIPELSPPK